MAGDGFYQTKAWYKLRQKALTRDKYRCVSCGASVRGKGMAHIDHKIRRRIAPRLALDLNNLQTLCSTCHNSVKQRDERNPERGCNTNGLPNDGSWD